MEINDNEMTYCQLLDALDYCEKDSDTEFTIYQKLVQLCEKEIKELEEDVAQFTTASQDGATMKEEPTFLDDYIAPMDNLARIYMERKEYAKALPLLEMALPVYRTLEIHNPNYTYQRYYALKLMVECLEQLGQKALSILYRYELKHLRCYVLEAKRK